MINIYISNNYFFNKRPAIDTIFVRLLRHSLDGLVVYKTAFCTYVEIEILDV